jgi:excisionase family DNA binding protein
MFLANEINKQTDIWNGRSHLMVVESRFLPLTDVAELLNVSIAQARALVRSGDLRAIKVGGRGQWRVEKAEIEAYIQRMYERTEYQIKTGSIDED